MQPLINTPPFVRALEELKAAAAHMPADVLELSPRDVLNRFLQGQTALAITWPSRALVAERVAAAGSPTPIKLALCPGSQEVYHRFRERWFARNSEDSPQVPLLGVTGRLASISRESSRAQQAARFLIWLTERRSSVDLLRDNPDAAPFRASHLENAGRWLPPDFSEQQSQDYAELVKSIEDSSLYLVYPRIPGQQKYLDALDDAIQQAITGQQSPREALDEAAEKWRQLTESLGSEAQHSAVRKHLGRSF